MSLQQTLDSYIETALWSTNDESDESGGEPLDSNYGPEDLAKETLEGMKEDVALFLDKIEKEYPNFDFDYSNLGHNFWLTRNGHGAGFWDDDRYNEDMQERLTEISTEKPFGEVWLYVDDDKIYSN